MLIAEIYTYFKIPQNLQKHMFRVAAIGFLVSRAIQNVEVDKKLVVSALLLHDLGNIIKFKFDDDKNSFLSTEDRGRVEDLKQLQAEIVKKYGPNTDLATLKMMKEIGVGQKVIDLCSSASYHSINDMVDQSTLEEKIYFYSDMRVGPFGVLSVVDRFDDLEIRYPGEKLRLEKLKNICLEFEKYFQSQAKINIAKLDDKMVDEVIKTSLINFELPTGADTL